MMKYESPEEVAGVVERVRMCMAEAGYVDHVDGRIDVVEHDDGFYEIRWWWFVDERRPPAETLWRARELSSVGEPACFKHYEEECYENYDTGRGLYPCQASSRLVKDCKE